MSGTTGAGTQPRKAPAALIRVLAHCSAPRLLLAVLALPAGMLIAPALTGPAQSAARSR